MPFFRIFFVRSAAVAILLLICALAGAQPHGNPAIVPVDRLGEPWWAERHQAVLDAVQAHPDTQLVLLGDSITNNYEKSTPPDEDFQPIWKQFYEPRKALNLGFSGDATEHVLWRLQHGEVAGLHPRLVVVLLGTNNTGHERQTAQQTGSGIDAVVAELEARLPETKILLLGILPSAISRAKSDADDAVNRYLATGYGENPRVTYLDVGSIFYTHGALDSSLFYDPRLPSHSAALHPDTHGQRMLAESIEPTVAKLLNDSPRMPLASMTGSNTALLPVGSLEQDSYDWYARHHQVLALDRRLNPEVVLIGDSITHFWAGLPDANHVNGPAAWRSVFGDTPVLNMGFGWDRTQNVLWRLRQGEFDGLHPKWIVLAIGTNNLTGTAHARASTPDEIVEAIDSICKELHGRAPASRIVLMAIFPRGRKRDDALRAPIKETNALLARHFAGASFIRYMDIGDQFLDADGTLPEALMPDGTHPSEAGYQLWADALRKAGVPF